MGDKIDIRPLLESWPYDPENNIRVIEVNGRQVMQVRTPMGIEQYELEGRPDGQKPHGFESLFDYHIHRMQKQVEQGHTTFSLNSEECAELFNEATLYYLRYVHLFQIQDWQRTIRDTTRNLAVFDFIHQFAEDEEDRWYLERWRPYVLRIRAMATAMQELEKDEYLQALKILRRELKTIQSLPEMDDETFQVERERAIESLTGLIERIEMTRPLSTEERLERELRQAIEAQEFERAAELRDKIRALRQKSQQQRDSSQS